MNGSGSEIGTALWSLLLTPLSWLACAVWMLGFALVAGFARAVALVVRPATVAAVRTRPRALESVPAGAPA